MNKRGVFFFLLTIISFLWKIAGETSTNVSHTIPRYLAPALQGVIATSIILDLVGLFGTWLLLWRYRRVCLDKMRNNDDVSSASPA